MGQLIFILTILFCLSPSLVCSSNSNPYFSPDSVLLSSIRSISTQIKDFEVVVASLVVNEQVKDFQTPPCKELLRNSLDVLHFSESLIANKTGYVGTDSPSSDIRAWLSTVLINQASCNHVLEGSSLEKSQQTISEIKHVLGMIRPDSATSSCSNKTAEFPEAADVIVSFNGSGNYTRIMDAVSNAPANSKKWYVIKVEEGRYIERVQIDSEKQNLVIIGAGINKTIISFNRSKGPNVSTWDSATMVVTGPGFMARDITIENTAGPDMNQAVALRASGDLSVFYRLEIKAFQDTLYVTSQRQFYKKCTISGTVDFIFGQGSAVFQNCTILARKRPPGQVNVITAQGQETSDVQTGFSFQYSSISAEKDSSTPTYLGRPWYSYSTTVFMQSSLSSAIPQEGWTSWNNTMPGSDTLFYGEYKNHGDGAGVDERVTWRGFHILSKAQALNFTVANLIRGDCWLPSRGITYKSGLEDM